MQRYPKYGYIYTHLSILSATIGFAQHLTFVMLRLLRVSLDPREGIYELSIPTPSHSCHKLYPHGPDA